MGISVRTLQRRLEQINMTYTVLVDEVRTDLACQQLELAHVPVVEVAKRLGFKDHSSFSRAFMRWKGLSPRAYRKAKFHQAKDTAELDAVDSSKQN
jgi:AraC-like DNA-binding protein